MVVGKGWFVVLRVQNIQISIIISEQGGNIGGMQNCISRRSLTFMDVGGDTVFLEGFCKHPTTFISIRVAFV